MKSHNRTPRRRVVRWHYAWWGYRGEVRLTCGHIVQSPKEPRGKHTRRACPECREEGK